MKKILLIIIAILGFTSNVYAEECNLESFPEIPTSESNRGYIVTYSTSAKAYRLFTFDKLLTIPVINNNNLQIAGSDVKRYNSNNENNWIHSTSGSQSIDLSLQEVKATNVEIKDTNNKIIYEANYGLACEITDNNVGVINDIAHLINDFYKDLESKNIKFYQMMIALVLFDFIVFVFCYIITHFRF